MKRMILALLATAALGTFAVANAEASHRHSGRSRSSFRLGIFGPRGGIVIGRGGYYYGPSRYGYYGGSYYGNRGCSPYGGGYYGGWGWYNRGHHHHHHGGGYHGGHHH